MISIVSTTNRINSNSLKVATKCQEILFAKGIESELFSLENLPADFIFSCSYGVKTDEYETLTRKYIENPKKFVFVIPEYNGSFPGVLKAFIDSLDFLKLSGKKAALIGLSSGHAGGLRALDHFTEILHHLKIEVYSDKPKLSGIEKLIDDTQLIDDRSIERLKKMLGNFIEF